MIWDLRWIQTLDAQQKKAKKPIDNESMRNSLRRFRTNVGSRTTSEEGMSLQLARKICKVYHLIKDELTKVGGDRTVGRADDAFHRNPWFEIRRSSC